MREEILNFSHQELLDGRFKQMGMDISEYTFANLYLFREIHQYKVVINQDIYIKGKSRDNLTYLMPTSSVEQIKMDDLLESAQGCDFLFPISEQWEKVFSNPNYQVSYLDEDSDYLYEVVKMSTFPGRKLSGRRNLLRQFQDLFPEHHSDPLTSQNAKSAMQVLDDWHKVANETEKLTDYMECREALSTLEKLSLSGLLTYVDGQPAAFVLGEELNSRTYVIHFAKALVAFKGIYQYIYNAFANTLANKYEMINLEQDLGAAELRHAKRAYVPDRLVHKLRLKLWKKEG